MNERRTISVSDALDAFRIDLTLQGREISARNYAYTLAPVRRLALADISALDPPACRALMIARAAAVQASSLVTFYFVLRSFCRWCVTNGHLASNPTDGIAKPRQRRPAHRWLNAAALRRMYDACASDQERLIVLLCGGCGLRSAELRGLRWRDVDIERGTLRVLGKGKKWRELAPGALACATLTRMRTAGGEHVTSFRDPHSLRYHVGRIARRAGVGAVTPHMLRHSFAVNWLEISEEDGLSLQALLGHSSPAMTAYYVRDVRAAAALRKQRRVDLADRLFG